MKYILTLALLLAGMTTDLQPECIECRQQGGTYNCAGNTLTMNSRLCMDMTEVSGQMYKAFLEDMKVKHGDGSKEFINNLPDFRKWEEVFPGKTMAQMSRLFLEDDIFALMPIMAVSYDQAVKFCEWRTQKFKEELAAMEPRERAAFPKDFKFRLPTAKEWSLIRFMYQENGMLKQIDKTVKATSKAYKLKKNTTLNNNLKISSIFSNQNEKTGLFNLFDNVAEMTSERGVAMGGSWRLTNKESKYDRQFNYASASAWLGFRCIFEIIE